jgi:hypothetical protein
LEVDREEFQQGELKLDNRERREVRGEIGEGEKRQSSSTTNTGPKDRITDTTLNR